MTTKKMLQFVTRNREMPEKRTVTERRIDFDEIYRVFAADRPPSCSGRRAVRNAACRSVRSIVRCTMISPIG